MASTASPFASLSVESPAHPKVRPVSRPGGLRQPFAFRGGPPQSVAVGGVRGRTGSLRTFHRSARSLHGTGRSAPSRAASPSRLAATSAGGFPLDRALGRPLRLRASCGANASERSNLSVRNRTYRMPTCHNCGHGGADHNWQRRTHWGHCADPGCFCQHYVPKTDRPKPVNAVIGRLLRKKRG
jgi:hypothetical protein